MGGHLNAYTSREQTCYYAKARRCHRCAALLLLLLLLLLPLKLAAPAGLLRGRASGGMAQLA